MSSQQRAVEESTIPLSTERKHAKCLSIMRTRAETLVKLVREETLGIPIDFVEWVFTLC